MSEGERAMLARKLPFLRRFSPATLSPTLGTPNP
jgi:hypothetical protein